MDSLSSSLDTHALLQLAPTNFIDDVVVDSGDLKIRPLKVENVTNQSQQQSLRLACTVGLSA
jgi:hypothetical protein